MANIISTIKKVVREARIKGRYPLAPKGEWYSDSNYKTTGGKATHMSPDEYLSKVRPLDIDDSSRDNIDDLKNYLK